MQDLHTRHSDTDRPSSSIQLDNNGTSSSCALCGRPSTAGKKPEVKHYHLAKSRSLLEIRNCIVRPRPSLTSQPNKNLFYHSGTNGAAIIINAMKELGWEEVTNVNAPCRLKWLDSRHSNLSHFVEGSQMLNRIPNCWLLTNKVGLLTSLRRFDRVRLSTGYMTALDVATFMPETYRVDIIWERHLFLDRFKYYDMWICKPCGLNQGRGIYLVRDIDEFCATLDKRDLANTKATCRQMELIAQRYISQPLLLEGRKFDVRCYMLIACTAPFMVCFHPGYCRVCLYPYNKNSSYLVSHLTNQYVQKKDKSYESQKEDTIWSVEKVNRYINKHYAKEKGVPENWFLCGLQAQLRRIMLHCFHSVKHKLKGCSGYFDLFGFDFLIDDRMQVWLIEVNSNPSLAINCSTQRTVIADVVSETLRLSTECFEKSIRGQRLTPLRGLRNFTVIYNSYSQENQPSQSPRPTKENRSSPGSSNRNNKPTKESDSQSLSSQPTKYRESSSREAKFPKPLKEQEAVIQSYQQDDSSSDITASSQNKPPTYWEHLRSRQNQATIVHCQRMNKRRQGPVDNMAVRKDLDPAIIIGAPSPFVLQSTKKVAETGQQPSKTNTGSPRKSYCHSSELTNEHPHTRASIPSNLQATDDLINHFIGSIRNMLSSDESRSLHVAVPKLMTLGNIMHDDRICHEDEAGTSTTDDYEHTPISEDINGHDLMQWFDERSSSSTNITDTLSQNDCNSPQRTLLRAPKLPAEIRNDFVSPVMTTEEKLKKLFEAVTQGECEASGVSVEQTLSSYLITNSRSEQRSSEDEDDGEYKLHYLGS